MSTSEFKFLDNEVFKTDAYEALQSQFKNKSEFELFYLSLESDQAKDDFIRVGSSYLFFSKSGDWHVNVARSNSVIDYFTNSFKLVSTLSITEGLSNTKHIDFFQWLNKKENKGLFPINNRTELETHYRLYKSEYGSIHNVKDFFNNLSQDTKDNLCRLVIVGGTEVGSIEELIKMIYQERSKFAHTTKSTLCFGDHVHYGRLNKKLVEWKNFKFEYFLAAVEEGIVIHFKKLSKDT